MIRITIEHKPREMMTDLKCFCMKKGKRGDKAEPRGTPVEGSSAVERHSELAASDSPLNRR